MCNRFAMFPAHLLRAGLTLREQSVLLCLLSYRNSNGQAWPSRSVISRDTGIHIPHIYQAVKSLAQRGVITIDAQAGVRTVYTFPCLDHPEHPLEMVSPAPAPVVAKNATAAAPAPVAKPAPAPAPEPVRESVPVATPEPAPAPVQQPVAKPQPEPAHAPVSVAPMPALEPAPPAPKRAIVSARVARLPDVDEAVRREVDTRPVVKSSGEKEVDPELKARAQRLAALCAENTARSREQKAAAQRFEDGVTAATEQVAKQRAAQDIAAARQRAAQNAARMAAKTEEQPEPGTGRDVIPGNGQNVEQRPAPEQSAPAAEKTTDGQNAGTARGSAARDGCYPAGGKTNPPEPVPAETVAQPAPEPVATVPVVVPESPEPAPQSALPIICAPQTVAPQQGELLPIEKKGRATRLPEDWQLPRKWGEWAMQEYGFTEDEVRFHARQFALHWWSSGKSNAYKVSWYLTWQKWMGGEYQKKQRYNNRPQQKSKMMQAIEYFANKYNGDFDIPF